MSRAAALAAIAWSASSAEGQSLIAFQGFETNSVAVELVGAANPGVLNDGQQRLELIDSGEDFTSGVIPEGSRVLDFVQPDQTFNPADPLAPLPAMPTGRVFNATDGSLPWRMRWANSRVPLGFFEAETQLQEDTINAFLRSQGLPEVDLIYVGDPEPLPGPAATAESFDGVIFNATTNTFVDLNFGGINGVTADSHDSFGVSSQARFDIEGGFSSATIVPEGAQALLIDDTDGALLLDFDPIETGSFVGLSLTFDLAIGSDAYEGLDRFAVFANGQQVFDLSVPADPEEPNPFDSFSQEFSRVSIDLSSFDNATSLSLRFLFDTSAEGETLAIDDLRIAGIDAASPLPGDYNRDDRVDAADYTVWRDGRGQPVTPGSGGDGTGDGFIDSADYDVWAGGYGLVRGPSVAVGRAVPEPLSSAFALAPLILLGPMRRRRRS